MSRMRPRSRDPEPQRRSTRQREAIARALGDSDRFRSAQDLHEDLRRAGERVGLTTVYRELQKLSERGQIDALTDPAGETIYRRCKSQHHHHHLVCRACGRSEEVASEEVEAWAKSAAAAHGFTSVTHVAEMYGVCAACAGKPRASRDPG